MRINIYAEELPGPGVKRVQVVYKTADTGTRYYGVRVFLKSPKELHDTPDDDDRSAVTFWGPPDEVARLLREAAYRLEQAEKNRNARDAARDREAFDNVGRG